MIKWLWLLIKAIIFRKAVYDVSFENINDRWYVIFPNWPLSHDHLQMVSGADDMLTLLSEGDKVVHLKVVIGKCSDYRNYHALYKTHSALTKGAFYIADNVKGWDTSHVKKQLWLCPVTLTVLGRYPQRILFKRYNLGYPVRLKFLGLQNDQPILSLVQKVVRNVTHLYHLHVAYAAQLCMRGCGVSSERNCIGRAAGIVSLE